MRDVQGEAAAARQPPLDAPPEASDSGTLVTTTKRSVSDGKFD